MARRPKESWQQAPEERWSLRRESAARAALAALEQYLRVLLDEHGRGGEWVDQKTSPLGRRRHLALARAGVLQASRVGRRVLVRRADVEAYLEGRQEPKAVGVTATSILKDLGLEEIDG